LFYRRRFCQCFVCFVRRISADLPVLAGRPAVFAQAMKAPKVSLLLPCLNARPFLEERIDSIFAQSFSDWEAIVLDSYSDDGSWEFFQSIASNDSRFRLHQLSREGVYAALNRGIELSAGDFIHIATCDDTMHPEFLAELLEAFTICPEAGIAACDVALINRDSHELTPTDMADILPSESINDVLALEVVRSYPATRKLNYRPPPHDCFLHFSAKSVYFSLTQLLIRAAVVRSTDPFDNTVGSIADLGWLVRLTNLVGTVHVPRKLTKWRFHGNQVSVETDSSHLFRLKTVLESALPHIYERHRRLVTRNDCAVLMLPIKAYLATSKKTRRLVKLEAWIRVLSMFWRKPAATLRAIRHTQFSIQTLKQTLLPMFLSRLGLVPKDIDSETTRRAAFSETTLQSGELHEAEH
jgi:glycosyltransferase involved in cell wall biosynthesis